MPRWTSGPIFWFLFPDFRPSVWPCNPYTFFHITKVACIHPADLPWSSKHPNRVHACLSDRQELFCPQPEAVWRFPKKNIPLKRTRESTVAFYCPNPMYSKNASRIFQGRAISYSSQTSNRSLGYVNRFGLKLRNAK